MFFCFCLLEVPRGLCWSGQRQSYHFKLGLSVLNGQLQCYPQALPITCCLGNVITNLFGRHIQGADLGVEGRYGTHSQIQNFDLIEVELRGHGGGGLVSEEPEFGMNEESCIWPPLILKLRGVIFFF